MHYRIGIDVGGTFTDFLLTSEDGAMAIYKVLSTPDDPSVGVMQGLEEMAKDRGLSLEEFIKQVKTVVHGTTVTTNAVLTRRGARTALLTTRGLRDALEMRRGIREEQYNNRYQNVKPLVPRHLRCPIEERLDYKGDAITPLKETDLAQAAELFKEEGVEAIAICFMNSFANGEHEKIAAQTVREKFPGTYLTVSSSFLPSIRFYDRLSTTVLNSYVGPILKNYLTSLLDRLGAVGFDGVLLIMQSNGGVVAPEVAMDRAAATLLSGPAGGPVAGIAYSSVQDYGDCITIDMGGTSFDAALVRDRAPMTTTEGEIDRLRIALPMLGIHTIGAGGGSIGWIDEGGLLRMGPQSAGAKPGPACYGLGGDLPTCTDADLVLGYLDPDYFAGGRIKLKVGKAEKAIKEYLADKLGMDVVSTAAGMYEVINVNMASGVREVTVKKGHDPREFPLVVAGGAGPVHACGIALELEIPVMIIPKESSIFCAAGMLLSDLRHDFVRTYPVLIEAVNWDRLRSLFSEMEREGTELLRYENISEERIGYLYSLDMRYVKQYHEVNVVVERSEIEKADVRSIAGKFHPEHDRLYGYSLADEGTPIELINLRLTCIGTTRKPEFKPEEYCGEDASRSLKGRREVYLRKSRDFQEVDIYDGLGLGYGNAIEGPAIVEQVHTSIFISPEYKLLCDRYGSYTLYLKEKEGEVRGRIIEHPKSR